MRYRSQLPAPAATKWRTFRVCRCAESPICYPGQTKTDARDAFIIAETARTMPHTLRRVDTGDDTLAG